jgi:hypothetical protein
MLGFKKNDPVAGVESDAFWMRREEKLRGRVATEVKYSMLGAVSCRSTRMAMTLCSSVPPAA